MEFNLAHAVDVLSRTPNLLRAFLEGLPPEFITSNEGDQTWSPYDVVGHLIHGERTDWIPRAEIILQSGETRPFEAFDRFAQFEASKGKTIEELLNTFDALRRNSLTTLEKMRLAPADLKRTGKHPELGRVTLEELLATWVAHDLDHIVQIARTLAKQYEVGPWRAFLSVTK
jgi:hypothetical protein